MQCIYNQPASIASLFFSFTFIFCWFFLLLVNWNAKTFLIRFFCSLFRRLIYSFQVNKRGIFLLYFFATDLLSLVYFLNRIHRVRARISSYWMCPTPSTVAALRDGKKDELIADSGAYGNGNGNTNLFSISNLKNEYIKRSGHTGVRWICSIQLFRWSKRNCDTHTHTQRTKQKQGKLYGTK